MGVHRNATKIALPCITVELSGNGAIIFSMMHLTQVLGWWAALIEDFGAKLASHPPLLCLWDGGCCCRHISAFSLVTPWEMKRRSLQTWMTGGFRSVYLTWTGRDSAHSPLDVLIVMNWRDLFSDSTLIEEAVVSEIICISLTRNLPLCIWNNFLLTIWNWSGNIGSWKQD